MTHKPRKRPTRPRARVEQRYEVCDTGHRLHGYAVFVGERMIGWWPGEAGRARAEKAARGK